MKRVRFGFAALGLFAVASPARALPPVQLDLVTTLSAPTYLTHMGDERLFIVQRSGEGRVQISAATGEREQVVLSRGFDLRKQHSRRCRRCFGAESCTFDEADIAHAAQGQSARNS